MMARPENLFSCFENLGAQAPLASEAQSAPLASEAQSAPLASEAQLAPLATESQSSQLEAFAQDRLNQLKAAYQDASRHYHNLEHITGCLEALRQFWECAQAPYEIAFALWYHDAVYDARRKDNEAQSAVWAVRDLRASQVQYDIIHRIERLIRATAGHEAQTSDEALMVDLDLLIFASSNTRFNQYEVNIRREYHWVPEKAFLEARGHILRTFLSRKMIYQTQDIADLYEAKARANLKRVLESKYRSTK